MPFDYSLGRRIGHPSLLELLGAGYIRLLFAGHYSGSILEADINKKPFNISCQVVLSYFYIMVNVTIPLSLQSKTTDQALESLEALCT